MAKKFHVLAISLRLAATPTFAAEILDAGSTTCSQAQQLVAQDGAVVIKRPSTKVAGLKLTKRYVRSRGQCDSDDLLSSTRVKMADDAQCKLAVCSSSSHNSSKVSPL